MKRPGHFLFSILTWEYSLVVTVVILVFFIPLFPVEWHKKLYNSLFTLIYFQAAFSIEKRRRTILGIAITAFFMEWISSYFDLAWINTLSKLISIVFFIIILISYIRSIAKSKIVNQTVILKAIIGYLLLAVLFSILVYIVAYYDRNAFNYKFIEDTPPAFRYDELYFSLVTISTLGYGDITPVSPIAKSLSTFISVVGQFYLAILIALLVGKYSMKLTEKG